MAVQVFNCAERQVPVIPEVAITRIEYHEKLNVILVGSEEGTLYVVDTNLGDVLYTTRIADTGQAWDFSVGIDRVAVATKDRIGIRSDYNGILLLNSILQSPISTGDEIVDIELSKTEAELLCQSLVVHNMKAQEAETVEFVKLLKEQLLLAKDRDEPGQDTTFSVKREKWNMVRLKFRHSSMKSALQGVVNELLRRTQYNPQLSIASSILERLNALLPPDVEAQGTHEKCVMFSEAARLNSFLNWPHTNYKWAHPVKMAQAGFFHSPSTTGEDRAMCFTCNVCLVSWEPTDEPWSEHERHSPFCPFVRGEHTHNVPMTLAYATCPSVNLTNKLETPIIGKSSWQNAVPVCYPGGLILIFDTLKLPKEVLNVELSLTDLQGSDPMSVIGYSDIAMKPQEAWVDDISRHKSLPVDDSKLRSMDLSFRASITRVALISSGNCPPSLVVSGGALSDDDKWLESWILIFSLDPNTLATEDIFDTDTSEVDAAGVGTKREATQFDDESFCTSVSLISEADMTSILSGSTAIFSDSNISDSETSFLGMFNPQPVSVHLSSSGPSATTSVQAAAKIPEKSMGKSKTGSQNPSNVLLVQKLVLPEEVRSCHCHLLEPTQDKTKLMVIVGDGKNGGQFSAAILVYRVIASEANIVSLDPVPIGKRLMEREGDVPVSSCFVINDAGKLSTACVNRDGSVHIFSFPDLLPQFIVNLPPEDYGHKITSVAYCSSIEKLWCGTNKGFLNAYSIGVNDSDDETQAMSTPGTETSGNSHFTPADLISNKPLNTASLQQLVQLTKFESVKLPFSVNAPSCWQRVIQAQKERKHPQHLHREAELTQASYSWRLQRNKESKKEHLFEITFPKTANVGHVDFKFSFQSGCTTLLPFEVTLYMARNVHNKRGGAVPQVDRGVDFGQQMSNRSSEFLKSANAEVVCGPLQLANHLDFSTQGGTVVMTSPMLLLSKGRNFFLHLKATKQSQKPEAGTASKEQKQPSPKKKCSSSKCPKIKSSSGSSHKKFTNHPLTKGFYKAFGLSGKDNPFYFPQQMKAVNRNAILEELEKRKELEGCDWLHEISITVRQIKESPLPNSEMERKWMLTSPDFVRRLLQVVAFDGTEVSYAAQSIALDLLGWIAGIKLCGPQLETGRYQLDFVDAVEENLSDLILKCILFADRSTAHKCAKLLILCFDVVEVYHRESKETTFLESLLKHLLILLPFTLQCGSAGALQWYFLLLNQVRTVDPSLISESMLEMLSSVSKELVARTDPLHAILRSRFGLYGTPFQPDLFDIEIAPLTKSVSTSTSYPGVSGDCASGFTSGPPPVTTTSSSKEIDFRDFLLGNPLRQTKLGTVSPKLRIHGLLEVEQLHFSCHTSSEGARIEKLDAGGSPIFSPLPMPPQHWEPFTNMPTGEGSKKSEPEKEEHMMILQNLSKLNLIKLDELDTYYDYLNDIKMLEGNLNLIDMMTFQSQSSSSPYISGTIQGPGGGGNSYSAYINPNQMLKQPNVHVEYHQGKSKAVPDETITKAGPIKKSILQKTENAKSSSGQSSSKEEDSLRLLISPWQQMMGYIPTQQALVIDRMHSGARRFVVLDFGSPILLTDLVISPCSDLASLSIDIWLKREELDGHRLVVASDIAQKALVINDLQPPPICRYLKITTIGRYGMGTTKCKIPLGMFYGHSAILPHDIQIGASEIQPDVPVLSPVSTPAHLSILGYVLEDIGCRYQLACGKLKRLLEPLAKPEIASIDHISYYLPKGKERTKLGLSSTSDQLILSSYQDCITLQQQLNVTKNVIGRLQRSLEPFAAIQQLENPMSLLQKVPTDKVRLISSFLVESLLGISFMSSKKILETIPYPLYSNMTQSACSDLFQNICVMENAQCQLTACTFLLRVCGFQPWWGNFLTATLKNLFSSTNTATFPQDRVFTLLVYLGQRMSYVGRKSCVLESTMRLLEEILSSADESTSGFTRAKIDMGLLGWTVMYLCLCLDGVTHSILIYNSSDKGEKKLKGPNRNVTSVTSRWNFIQGESVLHQSLNDTLKSSNSTGIKRRMQKKTSALKQKLEDLGNSAAASIAMQADFPMQMQSKMSPSTGTNPLTTHMSFQQKVEQYKQMHSLGWVKSTPSKNLTDLLLGRKGEVSKRLQGASKSGKEGTEISDIGLNLNLNPSLCYNLSKALGNFLLKMDSSCHSDVYLLLCKALARVATSCRPSMRLGEIFTESQILSLVQTGVGNDYVRQVNWSSSWVSHAIMCLILDLLEGEKLFPEADKTLDVIPLTNTESDNSFVESNLPSSLQLPSEPMQLDVIDAENETSTLVPSQSSSSTSVIYESDYESMDEYPTFGAPETKLPKGARQILAGKDIQPTASNLLSSLDSRMDSGIDYSAEARLRMLIAIQSEVVTKSLTDVIDVPLEVLRNVKTRTGSYSSMRSEVPIEFTGTNSVDLLSSCFDELFCMMANENCTINIEKVLLFWLSINVDQDGMDLNNLKPIVALSSAAASGLITALARNVGIGVQDWGLGFKCLSLVANQTGPGIFLTMIHDPKFPEMILKFISGSGINLQRNHVPAMGPAVCEDFETFFSRLLGLCQVASWKSYGYLIEVYLRILSEFLGGPFLGSEFPLDAFNKFLDVLQPHLKHMPRLHLNPAVLISIVDHLSQALYLHVFSPNKIQVKSNAELKGAPQATTATGIPLTPAMSEALRKPQNLENILTRLLSLAADIVTFTNNGKILSRCKEQEDQLRALSLPTDIGVFEELLLFEGLLELRDAYSLRGTASVYSISDIVVHMDKTMMRIFSVLANPNGKSTLSEDEMASVLSFTKDPLPNTITDYVIRLVSRLMSSLFDQKQIVQPLFKFLAKSPTEDFCSPLIVSQMFVLTVLKVIKEEENLLEFVNSNCVQSICNKLVASSKQFFSSCPTFASIIMQYIGRADSNTLFGQRRYGDQITELPGGIINVAPLGTITAVNFSAHPSEVLLQATPPHRRARAPVWSYHFYPEETFLELIVTLPCAILLKEVQIVPHISSLATSSPSAVMIEISRERSSNMVAMSPPVQCGGMTTINIQLTQSEVAQTVLLRLYKPKDSSTLGLSQIRILGCTTFCESAFEGLSHQHVVKNVESSAQWMYILDHAITAATPDLRERIIEIAVNVPDILQSCYSMLICPTTSAHDGQDSYLPHVASLLFHFGRLAHVNDRLMKDLLGPVQLAFSHGMIANTNVQSMVLGSSQLNTAVDLIYKLCCVPSPSGRNNLSTVIQWLEKCADEAVEHESQGHHIVPEYVQGVAAALWSVTATRKVDLSDLATHELLEKLLNWSKCLNLKSELKAAVDHMICSMCYCKPWLFVYLNFRMGILERVHPIESQDKSPEEPIPLQLWYEENSVWEHLALRKLETTDILCSPMLMTLARAAESERASAFIFESGLLTQLNALILHFWNYNHALLMKGGQLAEEITCPISTPQLIAILEFYGQLCSMNRFKDWFGTEGSIFWHPILHLLSIAPSNLKASCFGSHLYDLEYIVIQYLTRCCSSHPENQKHIATRLCEIIVTQKQSPHKAVFLHSLSSFCRRLLIQVLLENEKMVVQVKNLTKSQFKYPASSIPLRDRHPLLGVDGRDRVFLLSLPSTANDLIKLLEPTVAGKNQECAVRGKENPGTTYIGVAESFPASEIVVDEQPIYSLEEDVLQEIYGFDAGLKMSMKTPSKKPRSDKSREVFQVSTEPKPHRSTLVFEAEEFPDVKIPLSLNLSKVKAAIRDQNPDYFLELLVLVARNEIPGQAPVPVSEETPSIPMDLENGGESSSPQDPIERIPDIFKILSLPTTIEVFCQVGGFGLLAKHLPVVYPDTLRQMSVGVKPGSSGGMNVDKEGPLLVVDSDWVKIESTEEFYDEMMDGIVASTPIPNRGGMSMKQVGGVISGLPPHSMAAFGLFLGLPKYAEVLLLERLGAQCMLRLAMGVADDADGNDIFCSPIAKTLPTLPFIVLRGLLNLLPLKSDDGKRVREAMYESKAIHFILACLAIFTHQTCDSMLVPSAQHDLVLAATKLQGEYLGKSDKSDDKSHVYWAKGTGFGTGSTQETWSVERAMEKRVVEEENVTCLLQVLSSYINPQLFPTDFGLHSTPNPVPNFTTTDLPTKLEELLQSSCLFGTISLYLKNDSVLDMARHIPLYTAVLQFLRSVVNIPKFIPLLDLKKKGSGTDKDGSRISYLLQQMKTIVDSYSRRLTNNNKKGSKQKCSESLVEELQDEGLATLIYDIQSTATYVQLAVDEYAVCQGIPNSSAEEESSAVPQVDKTLEDVYLEEMRKLQFAFFEMIVEEEETSGIRFTVSHFYDSSIRTSWTLSAPARLKRLAQESITLSTSLPIAFGSTIFVRCDTDRLDVMKVLISGPAGTPYSNGCFEFDVYFPPEYPKGPMLIHLQTTGRQRIRFNPNLYADGKVCLSILNTWHGRPEEKWNPQTSSLLPVLVAIQSLILNAEPYFNEPGYEKSRGTEGGEKSSREYNAGIQIATLEWAMLDQIRHPSVCFKDVIHKHFWLKRNEILAQCQQWMEDLIITCRNDRRVAKSITGSLDPVTVFKNNLSLLRTEFQNMTPPPGLEFLADTLPPGIENELGSAESNSNSASEASQEVISIVTPAVSGSPGPLVIEVPEETDDGGDVDEPMAIDPEMS